MNTRVSKIVDLMWHYACIEAHTTGHGELEPEHFLAGLINLFQLWQTGTFEKLDFKDDMVVEEINFLEQLVAVVNLDLDKLRVSLLELLGKGNMECKQCEVYHRSPRSRTIYEKAKTITNGRQKYIKIEQFLQAMFDDSKDDIYKLLTNMGVQIESVKSKMKSLSENKLAASKQPAAPPATPQKTVAPTPYLDHIGRDLTAAARKGKLGPYFGRKQELSQIMTIIARSGKNNPVLLGEAGVGKTAVVEALAVKITDGMGPAFLSQYRIVEINMCNLLSGTKYRGDFEDKIYHILEECRQHPEIILFIDELHTIVGAGACEGQMLDVGNMFKPALARAELRCIGTTTTSEYRRYIEKDPALERRFEKVMIEEPGREEALHILQCLRPGWQQYHGLKIADNALEAAIDLSVRFDTDRQLPDKAIDLVDRTAAAIRISLLTDHKKNQSYSENKSCLTLTPQHIAQTLACKVNLPEEIISSALNEKKQFPVLCDLALRLKEGIIGQDLAISRVCTRLQIAHTGLCLRDGPLAVMLFLGPTGVGKTQLACSLARCLYGSEKEMIRIDMSELMHEHNISRLIGSPPGFQGYEQEGQLTRHLRTRPYTIVLLDEIEKAHPCVCDLFLQLFDDGRITDAKGRLISARHAVFIMTSNLGGEAMKRFGFRISDQVDAHEVVEAIKPSFRPEFLGRVDDTIVFRQLSRQDIVAILAKMVKQRQDAYQTRYGHPLFIDSTIMDRMVDRGCRSEYGARELRRIVEEYIDMPLSQWVIKQDTLPFSPVRITIEDEKSVVRTVER